MFKWYVKWKDGLALFKDKGGADNYATLFHGEVYQCPAPVDNISELLHLFTTGVGTCCQQDKTATQKPTP